MAGPEYSPSPTQPRIRLTLTAFRLCPARRYTHLAINDKWRGAVSFTVDDTRYGKIWLDFYPLGQYTCSLQLGSGRRFQWSNTIPSPTSFMLWMWRSADCREFFSPLCRCHS